MILEPPYKGHLETRHLDRFKEVVLSLEVGEYEYMKFYYNYAYGPFIKYVLYFIWTFFYSALYTECMHVQGCTVLILHKTIMYLYL